MRAGNVAAVRVNVAKSQARRQAAFDKGRERAKSDEQFRLICALYWGEGSKGGHSFDFSNSEVAMMAVVAKWLAAQKATGRCRLTIAYYANNGIPEKDIRKAWRKAIAMLPVGTVVVTKEATISIASKRIVKRKVWNGTAKLRLCSMDLLYEVLGGIEFLRSLGS